MEEFGHRGIIWGIEEFCDGSVVARVEELGHSDIIGLLAEEFGHSHVVLALIQELGHGDISIVFI